MRGALLRIVVTLSRGWNVSRAARTVVPMAAARRGQSSIASGAVSPEPLSVPRGLDPYAEHAGFPERWRTYLILHFGSDPARVAQAFGVSPRAARKWLAGETGCRGAAVAIAVQLHPASAPRMLFAAE